MARIKRVASATTDGIYGYSFKCPGCKMVHVVPLEGPVKWTMTGTEDLPTFEPSISVKTGHHSDRWSVKDGCPCTWKLEEGWDDEDDSDYKCVVCHSIVTQGRIHFCGDSTHALAGQTVDLPEIGEDE